MADAEYSGDVSAKITPKHRLASLSRRCYCKGVFIGHSRWSKLMRVQRKTLKGWAPFAFFALGFVLKALKSDHRL
ncbi:MAG: hypothetical protein WKG07_24420 [Hymenobacter sp.]